MSEFQKIKDLITGLENKLNKRSKMVIAEAIERLKEQNMIQDSTVITVDVLGEIRTFIKEKISLDATFKKNCEKIPADDQNGSYLQQAIDFLNFKNFTLLKL